MKRFLLRLASVILLLATLIPLAVSCADDPPPDNGNQNENGDQSQGGNGGGEQAVTVSSVEGVLKDREKTVIADFSSPALLDLPKNNTQTYKIREKLTYGFAEPTYAYTLKANDSETVTLPAEIDVNGLHFIEFNVYSSAATDSQILIKLPGGEGTVTVDLDFVGTKTYKVILSQISVKNPKPPVNSVVFETKSGEGVAYIGSISAVKDVYDIVAPAGVDLNSAAPYDAVIDKFVEYTIGLSTDNSEKFTQKIASLSSLGKQKWDHFKSTYVDATTPNTLFGQEVYAGTSYNNEQVMYLYEYIYNMACAYAAYGGAYYKNPELLSDILKALEYGYNCAYGTNIIAEGKTWGDWYHWDVPIPKSLIEALALIKNDIDHSLIMKYLEPFRIICYYPDGAAGNKLLMGYNVLLASALERDAYRLCLAKELIYDEFFYVDVPENESIVKIGDGGPYSDGSYVQHGEVAYTGIYGMALINNISSLLTVLNGTPFDFDHSKISMVYEWIFNNFNSVIYEGHYMPSLTGRGIGDSSDTNITVAFTARLIELSACAPEQWKSSMEALSKYYMNMFSGVDFTQKVPTSLINYCLSLYNDNTITPWSPTPHARVFGAMDRIFQYGVNYGVSISLSSTRIAKYESINTANETGWYHGDGMIYIHTDGYDYNGDYFLWAEPHLMPGVTANTSRRTDKNIHPMIMNSDPYAGGVAQGKYAVAGYILGYDSVKAFNSGTFAEIDDTRITAKKSYFMLDNEIVCIGTGIKDFSGDNVITVVENRAWRDGDVLSINGAATNAPATVQTTVKARTMHFTNMGGYVFLRAEASNAYDGATLTYQKASHTPYPSTSTSQRDMTPYLDVKKDFLEIILNHGTGDKTNGNVESSKYAYVYLPDFDAVKTEQYYAAPDVEILSYTENTHAIIEKNLKLVALNCFTEAAGETVKVKAANHPYTNVREITCTTPCSLIASLNENGETVITVSDPTQTYRNVILEIEIEGATAVVSADTGVTATVSDGIVSVTVNTKGALGAGFTFTVK